MKYLKSKILNFPNIKHAFSLRVDGVSPKPWDSLNCSYFVGDKNINVKKNQQVILKKLNFEKLFSVKQIHSNKVIQAENYFSKNVLIDCGSF